MVTPLMYLAAFYEPKCLEVFKAIVLILLPLMTADALLSQNQASGHTMLTQLVVKGSPEAFQFLMLALPDLVKSVLVRRLTIPGKSLMDLAYDSAPRKRPCPLCIYLRERLKCLTGDELRARGTVAPPAIQPDSEDT
jgi:hypothetical protein